MAPAKKGKDREPSKRSLREVPEVNFSKARVRRNPYAARIAREGIVIQVGRGRPKKMLEVGGLVHDPSGSPLRSGSRSRYGPGRRD